MRALLILFAILALPAQALGKQIAIVVNPDSGLKSLDAKLVRDYYLRKRKTFAGGIRVEPVDYRNTDALRKVFCEKVLKMSCSKYDSEVIKITYQAAIDKIQKVGDKTSALVSVSLEEGGIAYVWKKDVSPEVKVVLVLP